MLPTQLTEQIHAVRSLSAAQASIKEAEQMGSSLVRGRKPAGDEPNSAASSRLLDSDCARWRIGLPRVSALPVSASGSPFICRGARAAASAMMHSLTEIFAAVDPYSGFSPFKTAREIAFYHSPLVRYS